MNIAQRNVFAHKKIKKADGDFKYTLSVFVDKVDNFG